MSIWARCSRPLIPESSPSICFQRREPTDRSWVGLEYVRTRGIKNPQALELQGSWLPLSQLSWRCQRAPITTARGASKQALKLLYFDVALSLSFPTGRAHVRPYLCSYTLGNGQRHSRFNKETRHLPSQLSGRQCVLLSPFTAHSGLDGGPHSFLALWTNI